MSSEAWVVECTRCKCVVLCFAIDPQLDQGKSITGPPQPSAILTCSCCGTAYRYSGNNIFKGVPRPNPACAHKKPHKNEGALLVAASVIAAISLRGQDIKPSPKLTATVRDSVNLARVVLAEIEK